MLETFEAYDWPGNVRELKHCVERMVALRSEGALHDRRHAVGAAELHRGNELHTLARSIEQPDGRRCRFTRPDLSPPSISIPDSERQAISAALAATNGERAKAASC